MDDADEVERVAGALVQKCRSRAWGGAAAERYGATPSFAGRPMPYKFNEPRRHKIPGARYRVQNWPEYDRALQRRGDLTVWSRPRRSRLGSRPVRVGAGGRGTTRTWRSRPGTCCAWPLAGRGGRPRACYAPSRPCSAWNWASPTTTFARRSPGLVMAERLSRAGADGGLVHVVIDATGLKVFGAGEWLAEKHGARGKRTGRKLHLAVDPDAGEILACELTTNEEGDASQVAPLLEQIAGPSGR